MVNSMKADLDHLKKTFSEDKLDEVENATRNLIITKDRMDYFDSRIDSFVLNEDLYLVEQQLHKYATKDLLQNVEAKIADFVHREEFALL